MQSAYCQASDGGVEGVRPLARFLTAFSRKKAVSPKADAFVTPPQSGSGRKKQIRSKAAIRNCTHSFAQRVQYRFRRG